MGILNYRMAYFFITSQDSALNKHPACLYMLHGCQLTISLIANCFFIIFVVDEYLILSDTFNLHLIWVIYMTVYVLFTSLILKHSFNCYINSVRYDSYIREKSLKIPNKGP
jgi:tetrahydromethanopterin S-methyltransferase subunit C